MQLTEEQVIRTLYDYAFKIETKSGSLGVIAEANFTDVARQLLSKMQPNSDSAPPLQQAGVMRGQSHEPATPPSYCSCGAEIPADDPYDGYCTDCG